MVCQVGGPILLNNSDIINSVLGIETNTSSGGGGGMYYDTSFENMAQVNKASKEIIEETMSEGAVLLKNENNPGGLMCYTYYVHPGETESIGNIGLSDMRGQKQGDVNWSTLWSEIVRIGKEACNK